MADNAKQATRSERSLDRVARYMSAFGNELGRLMAARGCGVRELARRVPCNPGHISNLRSGKAQPSPELAADLDRVLGADGTLASLAPASPRRTQRPDLAATGDEIAALEFVRLAEASDVGNGVLEQLELTVDDLATAYPGTPPADLLVRVRTHLGYVSNLLDARATLAQHRRLLVTGGWLSLLAATCLIDLHKDHAATAHLRTAAQLARETSHAEIAAWCLETQAWQALTAGDYQRAADISQTAQQVAPRDGSAFIQATAQEGRAWARLGAATETRAVLARVEKLVSPLPMPGRPEHHYRYDPPKAQVYVVTTLSWLGDQAAERLARQVLAAIEAPGERPRPRRAALARLDLSLALTAANKHDEAAGVALDAIKSGRLAPVDGRRAREIVLAVADRGLPEARELSEAYRETCNGEPASTRLTPESRPQRAGRRPGADPRIPRLQIREGHPQPCRPSAQDAHD
jgi:transcriptional regulator with XRE-family HTH domain